jgi:hypothetical protein
MSEVILTRPQQIASMSGAMAELDRACLSMRDALRESNDERHQTFFLPVLDRINMIVGNEREGITIVLADDLANARSAVRRLRLPDIDPFFDLPTPALKMLRGERGNLIEAIDNALEAAAFLRMHPRISEFGDIRIDRHEVVEQLIRLDERLRFVQDTVGDLRDAAIRADAASDANMVNQEDLVNFHVKTLKVEVAAARFETQAGKASPDDTDITALTRAIEAMHEIACDLKLAVEGLRGWMADGVRTAGNVVVKAVERSLRGSKTVVRWVRHKLTPNRTSQPGTKQSRQRHPKGLGTRRKGRRIPTCSFRMFARIVT